MYYNKTEWRKMDEKRMISWLIDHHRIHIQEDGQVRAWEVHTEEEKEEILSRKDAIKAELYRQRDEEAAKQAASEKKMASLYSGEEKIRVRWQEGDPLSAYAPCTDEDSKVLKSVRMARGISGWGTKVESALIKALGTEFTFQEVQEFLRPETERQEAAEKAKADEIEQKTRQARETGERVLLRKWTEDCNDPREECSMDLVSEYVLPDGKKQVVRHHTW